MNDVKNIIQVTKGIISKLSEIDNIVDNALEPLKDFTDTASDLISPIRALGSFYNLSKRRKFKSFLKSYAEQVHLGIKPDQLNQRLEKYLRNSKNLELISESIDNAINSQSVICSSILGYFAGQILAIDKSAEYKDFIIINALENLFDEDLEYFIRLYDGLPHEIRHNHHRVKDIFAELEKNGLDRFHLELTLEKLKNNYIIGFDIGGLGNIGNAWGAFMFNENTDYFYTLLKKRGISL